MNSDKTTSYIKYEINHAKAIIEREQAEIESCKHWIERELESMHSLSGQNIAQFAAELQGHQNKLDATVEQLRALERIAEFESDEQAA